MDRYERQRRVGPDGARVDAKLAASTVLLVGVGGTGTPLATALVRAGVGSLIILDPDCVAETDLARQTLYHSLDAERGAPKSDRAVAELERIGGRTRLEGHAVALTPRNSADWISRADLVFDATDHLSARVWIDEACRAEGIPWIHLGAIEDRFVVIPFVAAGGPCFRCYAPETPPTSSLGTCETRGVFPATTHLAAAHGFAAFWAWLLEVPVPSGSREVLRGRVGEAGVRISTLNRDPECPTCSIGSRGQSASDSLRVICGRNRLEGWATIDRKTLLARLRGAEPWEIEEESEVVRARRADERLTYFSDGRVIYGPVRDLAEAERRVRALISPAPTGEK